MLLIFISCSLLSGQRCQDVQIPLLPEVSAHQCVLFGQQEVAKWAIDHPNWIISRGYKCAHSGIYAKA